MDKQTIISETKTLSYVDLKKYVAENNMYMEIFIDIIKTESFDEYVRTLIICVLSNHSADILKGYNTNKMVKVYKDLCDDANVRAAADVFHMSIPNSPPKETFDVIDSFSHENQRGGMLSSRNEEVYKEMRKVIKEKYREAFNHFLNNDPMTLRDVIVNDIIKNSRRDGCLLSSMTQQLYHIVPEWNNYILSILSDEKYIHHLIHKLSKLRPNEVLEKHLQNIFETHREIAVRIISNKPQSTDQPYLRTLVFDEQMTHSIRESALSGLKEYFNDNVDVFLFALSDTTLFKNALCRMRYGNTSHPRIAEKLLDLLVVMKNDPRKESNWGDDKPLDILIEAISQQDKEFVLPRLIQILDEHKINHCLGILKEIRRKDFSKLDKLRNSWGSSEKKKNNDWIIATFTDRTIENILEKHSARQYLWDISRLYVCDHVHNTLNEILNPEDEEKKEARNKEANKRVINSMTRDELSLHWDSATRAIVRLQRDLKDEIPYHYLYLKEKLPYNGDIKPWEFRSVCEAILKIYSKLPDEEKVYVLNAFKNFFKTQHLLDFEWEDLDRTFSDWLDHPLKDVNELITHLNTAISTK